MGEPKKKPGRSRKNGTDWELRRYVMLLAAVIVLILIGAVAMFSGKITNILGKKDGLPAEMVDTGGSGMVIEPDTKEYIQDFGGCILTENGEPGITELMNTYFQAVSDCDMDTFVKLFTSQDTSEEEHYRQEFEEQKQYISGYQNVKCYTTPGLRDGEMAAYVYYEILYTGVETPAPSLVRIYAVRAALTVRKHGPAGKNPIAVGNLNGFLRVTVKVLNSYEFIVAVTIQKVKHI